MKAKLTAGALALLSFVLVASWTLGQETPTPPQPPAPTPTPSGGTTSRAEPLPGGAPEIAGYKDKVVFVLDRSGSMCLADRFTHALEIMEQLMVEMPKDTKFDIYLINEIHTSLFDGNWYRPSSDMRKTIRTKIAAVGGLDYGGFTDLIQPLTVVAERRRPDAVYLLSDGVATLVELETEKIVSTVAKAAQAVKIPIHTIGMGLGQDIAEDPEQARAVLKGIAEQTGGIYREVRCETRPKPRAFTLPPPWAPPEPSELARLHLKDKGGKELRGRSFGGKGGLGDVWIEIEDPAGKLGVLAFEYLEPKLVVRTFLSNGKLFNETRPIGLKRIAQDRWISTYGIRLVPPIDDSPPDELTSGNVLPVKLPPGGSVDFVYKRGTREFKDSAVGSATPQQGQ